MVKKILKFLVACVIFFALLKISIYGIVIAGFISSPLFLFSVLVFSITTAILTISTLFNFLPKPVLKKFWLAWAAFSVVLLIGIIIEGKMNGYSAVPFAIIIAELIILFLIPTTFFKFLPKKDLLITWGLTFTAFAVFVLSYKAYIDYDNSILTIDESYYLGNCVTILNSDQDYLVIKGTESLKSLAFHLSLATCENCEAVAGDCPNYFGYRGYLKSDKYESGYLLEELLAGNADVILLPDPSKELLDRAKESGKLKMYCIAEDSLVFIVNSTNPIENITIEEIRKVYSGEIKSWKKLGSFHKGIILYQQEDGSDSQREFLKLMGGIKPLQAKVKKDKINVARVIVRVAPYKNYEGAIGYTFNRNLRGVEGLKTLSVQGIESKEKNYPLTVHYYAMVIDNDSKPEAGKFTELMSSPQVMEIINKLGFVPVEQRLSKDEL